MSGALSVRGVAKRFGELQALRDVSFDTHAGEVVAVVGPNGAGKTTLLSIIAGTQRPSAGTVVGPPAGRGPGRGIGWVPQQPALYSKLSVAENLRLFARLERVAEPESAVRRMLAQSGLSERAGDRLERLWEFICARSASGTSVVFSTHTLGEAQQFADRVIVLDRGELLFDGSPQAFMQRVDLRAPSPDGSLEHALVSFLEQLGR